MLQAIRTHGAASRLLARHVSYAVPKYISDPPSSRTLDGDQSDATRLKEAAKDILDVDADGIKQGTQQFVHNLAQGAQHAVHDSTEAAKGAAQYAKDTIHHAQETIQQTAQHAVDSTSHAAHDLASGEAYARAKDAASRAAQRIKQVPSEINEALHDRSNDPPAPSTSPPLEKHKDSGIEQERTF